MIKKVDKYGINPKNYQNTLIHLKELKENIQCNEKMVKSINNAINSYREINENLIELAEQITQRMDLSRRVYGASKSSSNKKKESPYIKGSKWTLKKSEYEIKDSETAAIIKKTGGKKNSLKKEEAQKLDSSTELAPYRSKREESLVQSNSYIEYLAPITYKPAPSHVRDTLSRYNIKNQVHSGTYGDIYEGTYSSGRRVSINVLPFKEGIPLNQATRNKLIERTRGWKRLKHENIVEVYDGGIDTLPHIVTEPLDGGALSNLMSKHSLSMEEAVYIMNKVLYGLAYAHEKGIIHQNLSPENIFLTEAGAPKIGDWGVGKAVAKGMGDQDSKNIYAYSAPEELDKRKFGKIGRRTDIFQLGILFYEMLTGNNPFHDTMAVGSIGSILKKNPEAPSSINPNIPPEIDEFILKALQKSKDQRWESADAMFEFLSKAIGAQI